MTSPAKKDSLSGHPPRSIDLKKFTDARAAELSSLFSVVASRLHNDFISQRNERRRTTSHINSVSKRRGRKRLKSQQTDKGVECESNGDRVGTSRRVRRRMEFKKNPTTGFSAKGDGTKLLRTHLWHAKRFRIEKHWGFCLPVGLLGSGRGSRAVLKKLKQGVLLHDASYSSTIQLEGPMDSIISILKIVSAPFPTSSELMHSILCGFRYGKAMLHHIGAPYSPPIAPVTYIWRPLHQKMPIDGGICQSTDSVRQLWIMVHMAALTEAVDTLRCTCEKILDNGQNVEISSRSEDLAKLEIIGKKSSQILEQVLHPVLTSEGLEKESDMESHMSVIFKHLDELPSGTVLSLQVEDPRELPARGAASEVKESSQECRPKTCLISELLMDLEEQGAQSSYADNLWISNMITPPLGDETVCWRRHQKRLAFYGLDKQERESEMVDIKESYQSCPILLLKNSCDSFSYSGWSIVLPLSWVRPFWISFLNRGAYAIGLQERGWVARHDGVPFFPFDFPDCKVYSDLRADEEATAFHQINKLHHPSFREIKIPCLPSSDFMKSTSRDPSSTGKDDQRGLNQNDISVLRHCSSADENMPVSTSAYVVRTSEMLNDYLNKFIGYNILLLPNILASKKCFRDILADQRVRQLLKGTWQHPVGGKFSFLRVLLQAYRNGSFEDGALVFAPFLSDLSLLMSKSDELLQIPQSEIKNDFDVGNFCNWSEQVSDGPTSQSWQRQLIGFVTSGFVRGCGKPLASALCNALMLAKLRHDQWSSMQEEGRLEIFVLVRNLTSTAYRLALATVVLEKQEDDAAYM